MGIVFSIDWEALVGSAEHGVVVVSLETMHVRPSQATILKLVQTFSKRKELFLMRYVDTKVTKIYSSHMVK